MDQNRAFDFDLDDSGMPICDNKDFYNYLQYGYFNPSLREIHTHPDERNLFPNHETMPSLFRPNEFDFKMEDFKNPLPFLEPISPSSELRKIVSLPINNGSFPTRKIVHSNGLDNAYGLSKDSDFFVPMMTNVFENRFPANNTRVDDYNSGEYTDRERKERIIAWKKKKYIYCVNPNKSTHYKRRKKFAISRPRQNGRFVKINSEEFMSILYFFKKGDIHSGELFEEPGKLIKLAYNSMFFVFYNCIIKNIT